MIQVLTLDRKSVFLNEQMKEEQAEFFCLPPGGSNCILILKVVRALSFNSSKKTMYN